MVGEKKTFEQKMVDFFHNLMATTKIAWGVKKVVMIFMAA